MIGNESQNDFFSNNYGYVWNKNNPLSMLLKHYPKKFGLLLETIYDIPLKNRKIEQKIEQSARKLTKKIY